MASCTYEAEKIICDQPEDHQCPEELGSRSFSFEQEKIPSANLSNYEAVMEDQSNTSESSLKDYVLTATTAKWGRPIRSSVGVKKEKKEGRYGKGSYDNPILDENDTDKVSSESFDKIQDDSDCSEFMDPVSFAKELVDQVVAESEGNIIREAEYTHYEVEQKEDNNEFNFGAASLHDYAYFEKKIPPTWPTIGSFTIEYGAYTIDEYLSYFDTDEDWMYVIYYQGVNESQCSEEHKFQVIYSLPTWKYPVAQATASMFFSLTVCRGKPVHCLVDVSYRYETFRKVHKPGVQDFNEKWLLYILKSKIKFFQTVIY